MKPKEFKSKSDGELLRYLEKILKDVEHCEKLADALGFGAGGEWYRKAAKDNREEAERARKELEYRGVIM